MDAELGASLLLRAIELEEEDRLFQRWVQQGQYAMSFDAFKAALTRPQYRSTAEIIEDVGNILESFEARR